ncbi:hypothetical protein Kpol_455p1, partial [Vanderwaltozyma polyspora DSM 70294]
DQLQLLVHQGLRDPLLDLPQLPFLPQPQLHRHHRVSSTEEESTSIFTPTDSSTPSESASVIRTLTTELVNGTSRVSDIYITITATASSTGTNDNTNGHKGLSRKNRNIIIGCVVGIGVPLLIGIAIVLYIFCIQSKKTDFIDSDGKVVTAYSANKLTLWWYKLLGKDASQKYDTNSPLGSSSSDLDQQINDNTSINDFDLDMLQARRHNIANQGTIKRNNTQATATANKPAVNRNSTLTGSTNKHSSNGYSSMSNDEVIDEDKHYNNNNEEDDDEEEDINLRNF